MTSWLGIFGGSGRCGAPVLLGQWVLGSQGMLWWCAAAAAPLLIHLWSRQRRDEVDWAAMQFLLAALRRHSRRIQLEQWLLLALRAAVLLLLGVALANPIRRGAAPPRTPRAEHTHWILVLDASYSMDYQQQGRTRFDAARRAAEQVVSAAQQGDGFSLVLMAEPPQILIGDPAFDPNDMLRELQRARTRPGGAPLTATLTESLELAQRTRELRPRLSRAAVCLFSDLGVSTWQEADSFSCRQVIEQLARIAELRLTVVGSPEERDNLTLESLQVRESPATAGAALTVEAVVRSRGGPSAPGAEVRFLVDGRLIGQRPLQVAPQGSQTVQIQHVLASPGEHTVEARIPSDGIETDNVRWLSLPTREKIRVLCVEGQPHAADSVALAINPFAALGGGQRMAVEVAAENSLLEKSLRPFDCVVLCNVARLGRQEASALRQYVHGGGGLILFLGDRVQPDSYNSQLFDDPAARVLPARLESPAGESLLTIDTLRYEHPIARPFRDHPQAGLTDPLVRHYFRLAPAGDAASRVALALSNGAPLMVERQFGRGRCVVVATAASVESLTQIDDRQEPWSIWSDWPSFPPVIHETINFCLRQTDAGRDALAGRELQGVVATGSKASVVLPDGQPRGLELHSRGEDAVWRWDETWQPGIYRLVLQEPLDDLAGPREQLYTVNVLPSEGALEQSPREGLPSQLVMGAEAPPPASDGVRDQPWFRLLLGAALALMLAESWLARRLGGPR